MNISEKIDFLREKRGISLTHLNKAIGAYRGKITDVKSGKTSFTEQEISVLAHELSTSTAYLLGNTDDPAPPGEKELPAQDGELSKKDKRLIDWFRSLPPEKQKAILIAQDGPEDAAD